MTTSEGCTNWTKLNLLKIMSFIVYPLLFEIKRKLRELRTFSQKKEGLLGLRRFTVGQKMAGALEFLGKKFQTLVQIWFSLKLLKEMYAEASLLRAGKNPQGGKKTVKRLSSILKVNLIQVEITTPFIIIQTGSVLENKFSKL